MAIILDVVALMVVALAVAMFAVAIMVPAARTMVRQASLETVVRFFISWLQCWCCSCAAAFDHVAADISRRRYMQNT
jgi:hypothetical protein